MVLFPGCAAMCVWLCVCGGTWWRVLCLWRDMVARAVQCPALTRRAARRAIDPFCTYNGTVVKDWTHRVREGGGSYTIAFWIKPQVPKP
eukprot:219667-Rhodomonas_salina.1